MNFKSGIRKGGREGGREGGVGETHAEGEREGGRGVTYQAESSSTHSKADKPRPF